jgi:F-type H+-transporting ATPase subunit epsilon
MRLQVFLPSKILVDQEVTKVVAEAENGSLGILSRHIDFVAALAPGILSFVSNGKEEFLAIDEGILIKQASNIFISTRKAMRSENLGALKETVERDFRTLSEQERRTRSILSKIEADFTRRFLELRERG